MTKLPGRLKQLAKLYGIQTEYTSMSRQTHQADVESILAILRAMGAAVQDVDDADAALRRRREELKKRKVEPVIVAWDGKLDGHKPLAMGYHDLRIKGQETFVISAPRHAYFPVASRPKSESRSAKLPSLPPRSWGLFVPMYALHSERNPSIGDLGDFEAVLDWMAGIGGRVAATLPLLAAFLDEPFEPSPYSPASRLFWNELYIDVTRLTSAPGEAPAQPLIDYKKEMARKRAILERLAKPFFNNQSGAERRAFNAFVRENDHSEDYAKFRAVTERLKTGWRTWPAPLRDGKIGKADYDEGVKNYHLYAQWLVQDQLGALARKASANGQLLYLDLPLGIHPDSYDTWRYRDFYVPGVAGGAPPDPVFTQGQNWGFPPLHPEAIRTNRHQYTIAYIRNHLRFARLLRIDHVMGLHRLFWIPDGMRGDKGVYVEYPAEELYAILSVESHRHQAGIVGENLGTVPKAVNSSMARHNIQQMYVIQYEVAGQPEAETLRPVPKHSVASVNTHDMPPFQAWLESSDIDDRLDLGFLDHKTGRDERRQRTRMIKALRKFLHAKDEQLYRAILIWLARSMANIVLVNAEDLWGEVLPQNVPATSEERPNWRRRIEPGVEKIRRNRSIFRVLTDVSAERS